MSAGSYVRTAEHRARHSERMKTLHSSGSVDYVARAEKWKKSVEGVKVGRKKVKVAIHKICQTCYVSFLTERYDQKYCGFYCYSQREFTPEDYTQRKLAAAKAAAKMKGVRRPRLSKEQLNEYRHFKNRTYRLSDCTYHDNIELINPNLHPRTRHGVKGGWQLDHIVTVREGFDKGMSPEELSVVGNLRMLPWRENVGRNSKS